MEEEKKKEKAIIKSKKDKMIRKSSIKRRK